MSQGGDRSVVEQSALADNLYRGCELVADFRDHVSPMLAFLCIGTTSAKASGSC